MASSVSTNESTIYATVAEKLSGTRRAFYSSLKTADTYDALVADLADAFAAEDPNFNRGKFVAECLGPEF
jgi:uncharacterized membrane protein